MFFNSKPPCVAKPFGEAGVELAEQILRDHHPAWWGLGLQAGGYVDTGTIQIRLVLDDLAQMCGDAEADFAMPGQSDLHRLSGLDGSVRRNWLEPGRAVS